MRGSGHLRTAVVAALVGVVAATGTVALAGSGVSGIMNLRQNDTVDNAAPRLTGANPGPKFDVSNTAGSSRAVGVASRSSVADVSGDGRSGVATFNAGSDGVSLLLG